MRVLPSSGSVYIAVTVCACLLLAACGNAEQRDKLIEEKWLASPHADAEAWAFSHWNVDEDNDRECATCHAAAAAAHEDELEGMTFDQLACADCHDDEEIPSECARCHSTSGYFDFLGLDGAAAGGVDRAAPRGNVLECESCHNDATREKNSSSMPSGIEIAGLGVEASCMDCHQGRHSKISVDDALTGLDDDEVDTELRLIDIHSGAAGPSQYGTQAKGGYEYDGRTYSGAYTHVVMFETCIDCHDAHSTEIKGEECVACHVGATTAEGRAEIRVSGTDFDGDGNVNEGLSEEISDIRERLLLVIKVYAAKTKGLEKIAYEDRRPYFFDEQGEPYATWTPRLLRAAYNYRYTAAPGGFAHGGKYHIELLYDSLNDLGTDTSVITRP